MATTVVIPNPLPVSGATAIRADGYGAAVNTSGTIIAVPSGHFAIVSVMTAGTFTLGGFATGSIPAGSILYIPENTTLAGTGSPITASYIVFTNS